MNSRSCAAGRVLLTCCAACALWLFGCDSCRGEEKPAAQFEKAFPEEPELEIPIALVLSEAQTAEAEGLVKRISRGRFPKSLAKAKNNATLFLFLAASSTDPKVITASLYAMRDAFVDAGAARGSPRAGNDYGLVVSTHLRSNETEIMAAALAAASRVVTGKKPYRPVLDAAATIAESHSNAGARVAALGVLKRVRAYGRNQTVVEAMLRALESDSPAVVSTALLMAYRDRTRGLRQKQQFAARAQALMTHRDPAVRGQAAVLAVVVAPTDPQVFEKVSAMLSDPAPATRSFAAAALERTGDPRAIHRLIGLVDDMASDRYNIKYRDLSGRPSAVRVFVRNTTVHDHAVQPIGRLSRKTEWTFKYERNDPKAPDETRKRNAKAAKAWYAKYRARLPKDTPPKSASARPVDRGRAMDP